MANHTGSKPGTIITKDATTFVIEVSSHSDSIVMIVIGKNHNYPVETFINYSSDVLKGLVYVYGYDTSCFEKFKTALVNQLGLVNMGEAPLWIKLKRGNDADP